MAEQVAERQKYGSLEDIPKELSIFLCTRLNDNLNKQEVNILCYLCNETLNTMKFASDLVHELSCQRKLNCHLLIAFLSKLGRGDLSKIIQEMLDKEENVGFRDQDLKDKYFIEKNLDQLDGFSLSKRSFHFRLLIVDIFTFANFDKEQVSSMKVIFDLAPVRMAACRNLLEMFVEVEKKPDVNNCPNDTIQFLITVLGSSKKAGEKVEKFRTENPHLFC